MDGERRPIGDQHGIRGGISFVVTANRCQKALRKVGLNSQLISMLTPQADVAGDYESVRRYLYGLKSHGPKYGIDRMRVLSERLGNPERAFPVIHIAGTNGKGSVAAMLENILRSAGCKTGFYTSPHLVRQGERVQINREILSEQRIVDYVRELQPVAAELGTRDAHDHPSFFEFMTAMAFLHFMRNNVDIAVIETGLGGRFDATNVVRPELSVITEIGYDHMDVLGDSLEKIAMEKAGIIKNSRPVVAAILAPEAEAVIRRTSAERGCEYTSVRDVFGDDPAAYPDTNLNGSHQRRNAATAAVAAHRLRSLFNLPDGLIANALLTVNWPGRWQSIEAAGRMFIFDAAHNPEGAKCLDENLEKLVSRNKTQPHLVVGVLGAIRAQSVIPVAAHHARSLSLVSVPDQARSCTPEELRQWIPKEFAGSVELTNVEALFPGKRSCALGQTGDTIVVTGSIYLVGQVMDRILNDPPVGQGTLQD